MTQESLIFYGGLNTIGGVHILYSNGNHSLIFDLGLQLRGLFDIKVQAHPSHGLQQYILTRMAPPVLPIYDKRELEGLEYQAVSDLWGKDKMPATDNINISVFISHIHQDHMALLPYVNEETTVYMHQDAHAVYRGVVVSGEYKDTSATIHSLQDLETVQFEDFTLQLVEVDHDTPGASGFLIKSKEHTIAFTGDWRTHGRNSERMERFITLCKEANVDILLTEGTSLRKESAFDDPVMVQEVEVADHYARIVKEATSLVYVNILARNVERVADFIMKTKELGRKLVMDGRTAALWHESITQGIKSLNGHPSLAEKDTIRVLESDINITKDLPYETISINEIVSNKSNYTIYLIQENTPLISQLERQGEQVGQSHYIHADGNPLTNRDPVLEAWLKEFCVKYHYYATGGHATPKEISRIISEIKPKVVIPLHSLHPSLVDSKGVPKYCPAYGEKVVVTELLSTLRNNVKDSMN